MIESIKLIIGLSGNDYDLFIALMAMWILAFFIVGLFNIFHSFFKKLGGW